MTRWSTVDNDNFLGDHHTPHGNEGSASEEASLLNNCYVLHCTRLMAKISTVLGNTTAASAFAQQAEAHAAAIHSRWFNASTSGYLDTRQGHLILALVSGVVPQHLLKDVLATLRHEIYITQAGHIDTGLTTTYFMYKYFADSSSGFGGHEDLAYTVTTAKGHPGYLDMLSNGTTFNENWGFCHDRGSCCAAADYRKDCCEKVYECQDYRGCPLNGACGSSSGSSSKIHGTLDGVGQLFVAGIGGIRRPLGGVGYQAISFEAPFDMTGGGFHARASFDSAYGTIVSSWASSGGVHTHNFTVPPNCEATVRIGGTRLTEGGVELAQREGVRGVRACERDERMAVVNVGSGSFTFRGEVGS